MSVFGKKDIYIYIYTHTHTYIPSYSSVDM